MVLLFATVFRWVYYDSAAGLQCLTSCDLRINSVAVGFFIEVLHLGLALVVSLVL